MPKVVTLVSTSAESTTSDLPGTTGAPTPIQFQPDTAALFGVLRGLRAMDGGRPLTLLPFLRVGSNPDPDELDLGPLKIGGDIRFQLGETAWSDVSVLTDFSQVNLDPKLINLNRFPLFLPEQRPFFVRGLDVFQFGIPERYALFFSRRIGVLDDGARIPIFAGAKLYGRQG